MLPKRRVRDAVGPSLTAARVERCVIVTYSLMARPDGSSASIPARQRGFRLPLLLELFGSQSCGHQQLDMLSLLLGRSRPDEQVVKVFPVLLVRTVRDDTSQLVVAPAHCTGSMPVSLGRLPWCDGWRPVRFARWEAERRARAASGLRLVCGSSMVWPYILHTNASVRRYNGTHILWHTLHGNRRPVKRYEQPDRPVATRARGRGRTGRSEDSIAGLTPGSALWFTCNWPL